MKNNRKARKERLIMLGSSLFVLTALTLTGVYVKGSSTKEKAEEYKLELSQPTEKSDTVEGNEGMALTEANLTDEMPNNDMDYAPLPEDVQLEEANSGKVENPKLAESVQLKEAENLFGEMEEGLIDEYLEEADRKNKEEETGESNTTESDAEESGTEESTAKAGETKEEGKEDKEVSGSATIEKTALDFSEEESIVLPVVGNVLINYSMDGPTYFATLNQYKRCPAMVIGAAEGTGVASIADAQIAEIRTTPELGTSVVMNLGNGYSCIYGQLTNLQVSEGSYVKKGDIIGSIAAPTKYYSVEGANLYFEMTKDGAAVDPMSYVAE